MFSMSSRKTQLIKKIASSESQMRLWRKELMELEGKDERRAEWYEIHDVAVRVLFYVTDNVAFARTGMVCRGWSPLKNPTINEEVLALKVGARNPCLPIQSWTVLDKIRRATRGPLASEKIGILCEGVSDIEFQTRRDLTIQRPLRGWCKVYGDSSVFLGEPREKAHCVRGDAISPCEKCGQNGVHWSSAGQICHGMVPFSVGVMTGWKRQCLCNGKICHPCVLPKGWKQKVEFCHDIKLRHDQIAFCEICKQQPRIRVLYVNEEGKQISNRHRLNKILEQEEREADSLERARQSLLTWP